MLQVLEKKHVRRPRQRAKWKRISRDFLPRLPDSCRGGRRVSQGGPRVQGVRLDGTDHSPPSRRHAHMRVHAHPRARMHSCAHTCACFVHTCPAPTHTHHRTHSPGPARDMESRTGKALGLQRPPPIPPQSCAGAASPRSCFSALGSLLPASESLENLPEAAEGPL